MVVVLPGCVCVPTQQATDRSDPKLFACVATEREPSSSAAPCTGRFASCALDAAAMADHTPFPQNELTRSALCKGLHSTPHCCTFASTHAHPPAPPNVRGACTLCTCYEHPEARRHTSPSHRRIRFSFLALSHEVSRDNRLIYSWLRNTDISSACSQVSSRQRARPCHPVIFFAVRSRIWPSHLLANASS